MPVFLYRKNRLYINSICINCSIKNQFRCNGALRLATTQRQFCGKRIYTANCLPYVFYALRARYANKNLRSNPIDYKIILEFQFLIEKKILFINSIN